MKKQNKTKQKKTKQKWNCGFLRKFIHIFLKCTLISFEDQDKCDIKMSSVATECRFPFSYIMENRKFVCKWFLWIFVSIANLQHFYTHKHSFSLYKHYIKLWKFVKYYVVKTLVFTKLQNFKLLEISGYLPHITFCFHFIDFQLNTDFPSQFLIFYHKIT